MPLTLQILFIGDYLKGNTTQCNCYSTFITSITFPFFVSVKTKKKYFQCLINIFFLQQVLAITLLAYLILLVYLLKSKQGCSQTIK